MQAKFNRCQRKLLSLTDLLTVAFILSATIVSPSHAQNIVKIVSPVLPSVEIQNETVKISGAFIVGAMYLSDLPSSDLPVLSAPVPAAWAGTEICVQGRSADGVYESDYTYKVPTDWSGLGLLGLDYPTKYPDQVIKTDPHLFGVSLTQGSCENRGTVILASYWNRNASEVAADVALLVNSLGADEMFVFVGDDPSSTPTDCVKSKSEKARAFDFVCYLSSSIFVEGENNIEIDTVTAGVRDDAQFVAVNFSQNS